MQKLPYRDYEYQGTCFADSDTSLDEILSTPDDSDHGYYIVCDISYTNSCKDRTEQLALMPNKRKIIDEARSEKLILDQNKNKQNILFIIGC